MGRLILSPSLNGINAVGENGINVNSSMGSCRKALACHNTGSEASIVMTSTADVDCCSSKYVCNMTCDPMRNHNSWP